MTQQRGEADLDALYRAQYRPLLRVALLLTPDRAAAEDLVQDAFAALQRRGGRLDDPDRAGAYLRVAVVNGARSAHRRRGVARRFAHLWRPGTEAAADGPALLADEHRAVARAVQRLPRRQRQVVALRYWADLSDAEIAAGLGISAGTVRATASRALDALRQGLAEEEDR